MLIIHSLINQVNQPSSTCVFLGFDTDPSMNITARIRGPNVSFLLGPSMLFHIVYGLHLWFIAVWSHSL